MASKNKMITIKHLSKAFGDNIIFKDISLEIEKGELVSLIGFSGSGKSTLLKIIAGLEDADSGDIDIATKKLGMAFQYSALFDSLNIKDNIAFPLYFGDNAEKDIDENSVNKLVAEKLNLVGLNGIDDKFPSELSGGMKKRVSFARAIINDPELILYDEPTAGLDPVASTIVEDLIVTLQKRTNAAGIVVTHQPSTIKRASDRVVMIYGGSIVWGGTPEELFDNNNDNKFAKQFREGDTTGPMQVQN